MSKKWKWQNNSIRKKMILPMFAVLVIQAALFCCIIFFGGTISQLKQNALDILNERVINRKNYIQFDMIRRWSNLSGTVESVQETVQNVLQGRNAGYQDIQTDSDLSVELLDAVSTDIVYLLRKNSVTGAFLILNGAEPLNTRQLHRAGLYIRDLDPESSSGDNSDLLLERAPTALSKKLGITTDTEWRPNFQLTPQDKSSNFFVKPLQAALDHPEIASDDLGYWSAAFMLSENDISVITYSIPLIGEDGTPYGVLGVEISLDYLRKLLPYDELATEKEAAYLLAVDRDGSLSFDTVISNGPVFRQLFGTSSGIRFNADQSYNTTYRITETDRFQGSAYGCIQYFQLYNSNTPFEQERWALIGITEENKLFTFVDQVKSSVTLAFVLSLLIGLASVLIISSLFTKPISSLVQKVKDSNPRLPVHLDKIQISEIDELAAAIEHLSTSVADSSSKLSQIIQLTSVRIGAFEVQRNSGEVYFTDTFFPLMGLEGDFGDSNYMPLKQFKLIMTGMEKFICAGTRKENSCVIHFLDSTKTPRWVSIKIVHNGNRILGVAEDVTSETLEKQRIEYERDYDLLTNLLNRRAFHSAMDAKFLHPENLGVAALIMLDLDNLKYINDTYGHDYGDMYIRCMADILKKYTPGGTILSRMSGDEFYVFLSGYQTQEEVRGLIEDLKNGMQNTAMPLPDNTPFRVRASAGIAWYPENSDSWEDLVHFADFAMYAVKNTAKGLFNEFNPETYRQDSYLMRNKELLNKLIEERLVDYAFQPIVNAVTGELFAYEALMRSRLRAFNNPIEILTIARSQSKLYQIERLTWTLSLRDFRRHKTVPANCKLFVNSIASEHLSPEDILELEKEYGDTLSRVVVELTEEERGNAYSTHVKKQCSERWHAEIALDDFGNGYNGDSMLLAVDPDYIKIDMSIVRNIHMDKDRQQLLKNILVYAHGRHIQVIAEGVETADEMETLIQSGVDYLQGYYLGVSYLQPQPVLPERRREIQKMAAQRCLTPPDEAFQNLT